MFYSDEERTKLGKEIKVGEVKLRRECVFFEHGDVLHAGCARKRYHPWRYHLYLSLEDMNLKGAVTFMYEDLMRSKAKIQREAHL